MNRGPGYAFASALIVVLLAATAIGEERTERFDADPNWEGWNNRAEEPAPRIVRQDFGYGPTTSHAGGRVGEVGGFVTPAAEPSSYAMRLEPQKSLNEPLTASGRLTCPPGAGHMLLGFFNSGTVNEWRTPNTIAIRINGRGDFFYAYVEYATARWRAGGDDPGGFATSVDPETGRATPHGVKAGVPHDWMLRYDPNGNGGTGAVTVTLGSETAVCHLAPGHKADGGSFDRLGLLPVLNSVDGGGEVWLDDVTVNGRAEDFTRDPGWEGIGNRRGYESANVRPRFDFGFSPTRHAGGLAAGELGGLVFRGDCREPGKLAAYGDRLAPLSLDEPLRASGKVSLRRAVSDSTVLIGFSHSEESLAANPSQSSGFPRSFLGAAIEGPSREGFFFYPVYRTSRDGQDYARGDGLPRILPDGASHDWTLEYEPAGADGRGRIKVTLDGATAAVDLAPGDREAGARFDRFGIVTTWIDGNGQQVYFDDLKYTCRP